MIAMILKKKKRERERKGGELCFKTLYNQTKSMKFIKLIKVLKGFMNKNTFLIMILHNLFKKKNRLRNIAYNVSNGQLKEFDTYVTIHISESYLCRVKNQVFYYITQSKFNTNNNCVKHINLNITFIKKVTYHATHLIIKYSYLIIKLTYILLCLYD